MSLQNRHILFLENREKTAFWKEVADRLAAHGFQITWIVQNPAFGRNLGANAHLLGFPSSADLRPDPQLAKHPLLVAERGHTYFQSGTDHYRFYWDRIDQLIEAIGPDFVIGESTLLHELMAIAICKEKGISFLHPVGERYPNYRLAIFDGALQRPYAESGEAMSWETARDLADRIANGREMPSYMAQLPKLKRLTRRLYWALTRSTVWFARLRGEKYNTPSIVRKFRLFREKKRNMQRWRVLEAMPAAAERSILYPLQMQPENTMDVWGLPDFDQVEIVKRLLAAAPDDVTVSLKANPKPYYELSDTLLDFASRNPRVRLLPFDMEMTEAMQCCAGAVTITGTVGYEAVFGRGRCISVSHPVLTDNFPEFSAASVELAAERIMASPQSGTGSVELGAKLLQILNARSYPGYISDPISDARCMEPDNLNRVAHAILRAIDSQRFFADNTEISD